MLALGDADMILPGSLQRLTIEIRRLLRPSILCTPSRRISPNDYDPHDGDHLSLYGMSPSTLLQIISWGSYLYCQRSDWKFLKLTWSCRPSLQCVFLTKQLENSRHICDINGLFVDMPTDDGFQA